MGETLTERRRVDDEGRKVAESFGARGMRRGGNAPPVTVAREQAPANYVPAAAVTRKVRALFGIIGRKGHVGGRVSRA